MKWLLDTNVISETIKRQPHQNVIAWLAQQPADQMAISIVTVAEIKNGISFAPESDRRQLTRWFEDDVEPKFAGRVLPLASDILIDWIRLCRRLAAERMTRRAADLLLAATVRVHKLTLVTRNVRDFTATGLVVYDPWNGKTHVMDT